MKNGLAGFLVVVLAASVLVALGDQTRSGANTPRPANTLVGSSRSRTSSSAGISSAAESIARIVGIEYTGLRKPGNPHILGYSTDWLVSPLPMKASTKNIQKVIDGIAQDGGWSVLAHPDYRWGDDDTDVIRRMSKLHGFTGIEVCNGRSVRTASGDAQPVWDGLLAKSIGKDVWGFGNDDYHGLDDFGVACNVALATGPAAADIETALREGNFYVVRGSKSLRLEDVSVTDMRLGVVTNEGTNIEFVNDTGVLMRSPGEIAFYHCDGTEGYVRVRVTGRSEGEHILTQPVRVASDGSVTSPYSFAGRTAYEVNLHAHTGSSDGTPGETAQTVTSLYANAGYDLLAITDHDWLLGWPEPVAPTPPSGVAGSTKLPKLEP